MGYYPANKRIWGRKWNLKHVIQNSPGDRSLMPLLGYTRIKLIRDFLQVGQDCDSLSKYPPKIPAAPSARALTSPLIDLFKNPATVAQNSERKNNLTGELFS